MAGHADDNFNAVPVDIEIPGNYETAFGYDCLNGVNQDLFIHKNGNRLRIKGILVNDYPVLLRLKEI